MRGKERRGCRQPVREPTGTASAWKAVRQMASQVKQESRVCEVCGNEYDKAFQVVLPPPTARASGGEAHTFDSFECAIHALAPVCEHCGCRVVGHGVEANGSFFCCANCAHQAGYPQLQDRV